MTTYATRSPLQPLLNPYMMSELRRSSRRISAGLAQKEDPSIRNGAQAEKEREKSGPTSGSIAKPEKKNVNGNGSKTAAQRGKRKLGEWSTRAWDYITVQDIEASNRSKPRKSGILSLIDCRL